MNSNENDVLFEANILICYMPKMDLRMQSYGTMNMAKYLRLGTKVNRRPDPDLARISRNAGVL